MDGKALRLRKTLVLEDTDGHKLAKIQEKVLRIKDAMEVEDADGHRMAMVKKALISPFRERWSVEVEDGPDLDIKGNILDHEYTFTDGHTAVATVSKQWFRVADTYGVEVEPGQDPVVVLAATVALDMMAHETVDPAHIRGPWAPLVLGTSTVGPVGIEPTTRGLKSAALPVELEARDRDVERSPGGTPLGRTLSMPGDIIADALRPATACRYDGREHSG